MSEKTTFVGPTRAAQKRVRARAVPGVAQQAAQVRAEIAESGPELDLATLVE